MHGAPPAPLEASAGRPPVASARRHRFADIRDTRNRLATSRSLANLTKQNIDQLTALVKTRLRRMQYRPGLLDGFLAKTGLDLSNFQN